MDKIDLDYNKTNKIQILVHEIGIYSAKKKQLKDIISKKQDELKKLMRDGDKYLVIENCENCKGNGHIPEDGTCISCDGLGERFYFQSPSKDTDKFTAKIYDVTQRQASMTRARKLLHRNTFNAIFKPLTYTRIDIRITAYGKSMQDKK